VITRDAVGAHRAELLIEPAPELLQSHTTTLTRRGRGAPSRHGRHRRPIYPRDMLPGTGSPVLDVVLEVGIIAALVVTIVLLIRNYRDRR